MTYYEEFGVQPNATAGQIHQAYKTLVRLFHPDSQTDEALKAAAELQMRRLNGMLETLLDAEKRCAYDESLCLKRVVRLPPAEIYRGSWKAEWPGIAHLAVRHWFWVLTGLVVAGAAIWYTAIKDSASAEVARAPVPVPSEPKPSIARPAPPPDTRAARVALATEPPVEQVARTAIPSGSKGSGPGVAPPELPPTQTDPEIPDISTPPLAPAQPPLASLHPPPAAMSGETEIPPANLGRFDVAERRSSWAGNWLYAPRMEDAEDGLYAPSYIEFTVVEDHGKLTGDYRARYRVPDKALPSEVGFRAEGKVPDGNRAQLLWASNEGARGGVEIVLRSSDLLKVTWWTTTFGRHAGLTSGTATLVRERTR